MAREGDKAALSFHPHVRLELTRWLIRQRPIGVKEIIRGSQWQLEVNACNRPVARENASDQGAIGFSLHLIG